MFGFKKTRVNDSAYIRRTFVLSGPVTPTFAPWPSGFPTKVGWMTKNLNPNSCIYPLKQQLESEQKWQRGTSQFGHMYPHRLNTVSVQVHWFHAALLGENWTGNQEKLGFWRNVSVFKYDHRKQLQVKKGSSNSRRFLDNNNQWTVTTFRSLRVLNRAESLHLWNFQGYLCVLWLPRKKSATSEGRDVQGNVPPQKSPWPQEVASARHATPIRWSTFLYFYFP